MEQDPHKLDVGELWVFSSRICFCAATKCWLTKSACIGHDLLRPSPT